jgi:ribonuclease P protein component
LQKYITLKENSDFNRVYYRGKSSAKPQLVVYVLKNRLGVCRIGITTSKKIGNAVERNRSRRIIRAAFQSVIKEYDLEGKGYDFVFVARTKTKYLKSTHIEKAMTECFKDLGVIK